MSLYGDEEPASSGKSTQQTVSTMKYFTIQIMGFCYFLLLQSTMRKNKNVIKGCNDNYSSLIYKIDHGDSITNSDAGLDGGKHSRTGAYIPQ